MGRPVETAQNPIGVSAAQHAVTDPSRARLNNPGQESRQVAIAAGGTQGKRARIEAFGRLNREKIGAVPPGFGGTYDGGGGLRFPSVGAGLSPEGLARKNGLDLSRPSRRDQQIQNALDTFRARASLLKEYPLGEPIKVNEALFDTALHEVDHGLAIYFMGGVVTSMTVIPGAGYLGLTEFAGLDPVKTQIAAMASSVLHGKGISGDLALANYLAPVGISIDSAQDAAKSILNRVPSEMRTQIAQMVAAEGTVRGSRFADIIERAALESALFGNISSDELQEFITRSEEQRSKVEYVESSDQPRTRIIDISPTETVIQVIALDKRCPSCGQPITGAHFCIKLEDKKGIRPDETHPTRRGQQISLHNANVEQTLAA